MIPFSINLFNKEVFPNATAGVVTPLGILDLSSSKVLAQATTEMGVVTYAASGPLTSITNSISGNKLRDELVPDGSRDLEIPLA